MTAISFRFATPDDGAALLAIHQRAIAQLGRDFYDEETLKSWAHGLTAEGYATSMQGGELFEVAIKDGKIIAFCGVKGAEIYGLFVDPDIARQGVGKTLVERALERLYTHEHYTQLHLESSLAAVMFYQSCGWVEISRHMRPTRGGLPMEVVDMQLNIRS